MEPGGFGDALGNDVSQLRRTIAPLAALLAAGRAAGMLIMHTREGHKPDLSDLHETKKTRGRGAMTIGDLGPMRSEEHTSELQSLMRISYAVFCLKKKNTTTHNITLDRQSITE